MHWGSAMGAELATDRQRARFEAVRRRVFEEMQDVSSRKRNWMMMPFQVIVVAILAARGAPPARLAIQIAAFALCLVAMTVAEKTRNMHHSVLAFVVASTCMLVSVGNTGGLSSPLLLSVVPFLVGNSMNPNLDRKRHAVLAFFLVGFVVMATFSNTAIGELCEPLAPRIHWASSEFIALSFISATMASLAVFKMGRTISLAYERIALELAVRREELCDESEGRTRALEGIAARLAHEVKNPLAAIKGLSTHVARNATDEKVKERLTIVASEAERLQEIVEGFLSFSRGLDDLTIAPTKPYDIARELSLLLETRAADAGVTLEVRGSRELDAQRRRQEAAPGAPQPRAQRDAGLDPRHHRDPRGRQELRGRRRRRARHGSRRRHGPRDPRPHPEALLHDEGGRLGPRHRGRARHHRAARRHAPLREHAPVAAPPRRCILPACAREAQAKKTKLPNPCRAAFANALEPFTGKKSDGMVSAGAAVVASMGAQPEKVPS